jgi:hypothetical protein
MLCVDEFAAAVSRGADAAAVCTSDSYHARRSLAAGLEAPRLEGANAILPEKPSERHLAGNRSS